MYCSDWGENRDLRSSKKIHNLVVKTTWEFGKDQRRDKAAKSPNELLWPNTVRHAEGNARCCVESLGGGVSVRKVGSVPHLDGRLACGGWRRQGGVPV